MRNAYLWSRADQDRRVDRRDVSKVKRRRLARTVRHRAGTQLHVTARNPREATAKLQRLVDRAHGLGALL